MNTLRQNFKNRRPAEDSAGSHLRSDTANLQGQGLRKKLQLRLDLLEAGEPLANKVSHQIGQEDLEAGRQTELSCYSFAQHLSL